VTRTLPCAFHSGAGTSVRRLKNKVRSADKPQTLHMRSAAGRLEGQAAPRAPTRSSKPRRLGSRGNSGAGNSRAAYRIKVAGPGCARAGKDSLVESAVMRAGQREIWCLLFSAIQSVLLFRINDADLSTASMPPCEAYRQLIGRMGRQKNEGSRMQVSTPFSRPANQDRKHFRGHQHSRTAAGYFAELLSGE